MLAGLFAGALACGANAPAVTTAETSCLNTYATEIVSAFAAATPQGDAMGIVLSVEALACARLALGVKAQPRPADAGTVGG
jgi:hypothetical protein